MTQPPADPPADPDAGLTDEQKAAKTQFKSWFNEAFAESVTALREAEPADPPKRTQKKSGTWMDTLFGGATGGE